MKSPVRLASLLAVCALAALPLYAQDDMGVPAPPPPSPENGPYGTPDQAPPPDQGAPAPDQQTGPDQTTGDQPATFQTFYDNLGSQGTWIQSSDYGYVWQPSINDPNWAPYTSGHWVYSDAGWTWVTDEPWGWATYHYGRWVNLDGTGWCWVPGYTWAPAWVSWRYGAGYCGWAPLPPESFVGIDYIGADIQITAGFHIGGDCDSYYGIGAGWYHFMPVSCLGYTNYRGHYANWQNNYAIINRTTNVTNLNVNHGSPLGNGSRLGFSGVTTGGPSLAQVNASSATPVQNVHLTGTRRPGGGGQLANNSLSVFAPQVAPGTNQAFQPSRVGGSLGRATINRGVDVTRPLAVNQQLSVPSPTAGQIQQAQLAQYSAPIRAHVATPSTPLNSALQTPLTAMQPVQAAPPQRMQNNGFNNAQRASASPSPNEVHGNNGWGNHAAGAAAPQNNSNYHSWTPANQQAQSSPQTQSNPSPATVFNRQVQQAPGFSSNGSRSQTQMQTQMQPAQQTQSAPAQGNAFNRQFGTTPAAGSVLRAPVQPTPQPQAQAAPSHSFSQQPQSIPNAAPSNQNFNSQPSQPQPTPAGNGNNGNQWGNHGGNGQDGNHQNGNGWNGNRQQNH